jgi:hypothetical protein
VVAALLLPGSAGAVEAPSIKGESVSNVSATEATLEAEIDAVGTEHGLFFQFQLLHDPGEAPTELACPPAPPPGYSVCVGPQSPDVLPLGFVSGSGTHQVTQDVSGLDPGHTYFYRVLAAPALLTEDAAEWEGPALVGPSQSFQTGSLPPTGPGGQQGSPPPPGPPSENGLPPHRACHRHSAKRHGHCGHGHHHRKHHCGAHKRHCG